MKASLLIYHLLSDFDSDLYLNVFWYLHGFNLLKGINGNMNIRVSPLLTHSGRQTCTSKFTQRPVQPLAHGIGKTPISSVIIMNCPIPVIMFSTGNWFLSLTACINHLDSIATWYGRPCIPLSQRFWPYAKSAVIYTPQRHRKLRRCWVHCNSVFHCIVNYGFTPSRQYNLGIMTTMYSTQS